MTPHRGAAAVATVALLASVPGCSFVLMRDPPPPAQLRVDVEPDCSDGRGPPVIDLFGAGMSALSGLFVLALADLGGNADDEDVTAAVLIFGASTVLFAASAVSGFRTARRCRGATAEWYTMRTQYAPPVYQPPPPVQPNAPGAERGMCRPTVPACNPGLVCALDRKASCRERVLCVV